jgi:hypothetical protein
VLKCYDGKQYTFRFWRGKRWFEFSVLGGGVYLDDPGGCWRGLSNAGVLAMYNIMNSAEGVLFIEVFREIVMPGR